MRVVIFCHSLLSDWNHGNAHFLRGIVRELQALGHEVLTCEPTDAWSLSNLVRDHGTQALAGFRAHYPELKPYRYDPAAMDVAALVEGADLVLVHEWNSPEVVREVGRAAHAAGARVLFHDTHHRAATAPEEMARVDLEAYDGVLAFGEVLRALYLERGWTQRAWVWHEAADARLCRPCTGEPHEGDVVWIGNWGDEERAAELHEFLIAPVQRAELSATIHGVRYPQHALDALAAAGIRYAGWLPNYEAPRVYARYTATVHVARRPYARMLPGIPTIRVFEALACGIPLVSAPWQDSEGLFEPGIDYLVAKDGEEMASHLKRLVADPAEAAELGARGRRTVLARHTCAHRVRELLAIAHELGIAQQAAEVVS